ncbi:hypothetical protein Btru_001993 [Bulinus truncatus]|nr:hypothetical protein Btru_001993 [Bulinus truncatus]
MSERKRYKVVVIGAGIVGLSSAVVIQQSCPDIAVEIVADVFSPDTTSDGSAGFWEPYAMGSDMDRVVELSRVTYDYLMKIVYSPQAADAGITLLSGFTLSDKPESSTKLRCDPCPCLEIAVLAPHCDLANVFHFCRCLSTVPGCLSVLIHLCPVSVRTRLRVLLVLSRTVPGNSGCVHCAPVSTAAFRPCFRSGGLRSFSPQHHRLNACNCDCRPPSLPLDSLILQHFMRLRVYSKRL